MRHQGVDLAIIEVWTDDSDPTHNEYINIYAKIKNQGTEVPLVLNLGGMMTMISLLLLKVLKLK